jgi:tyrosyl-tRNA synthetase
MSIKDELIITYFQTLTDVPLSEVEQMQQAIEQEQNPMLFKKKLAWTITADLHDKNAANQAQAVFEQTVQADELPPAIPQVKLPQNNMQLLQILSLCQPESSNSQLRRLAEQGGVRLMPQDQKLTNPYAELEIQNQQVIRIGKRDYYQLMIA